MLVCTISVAQTIDSSKKSKKKGLLSDFAIYAGVGTQQLFHIGLQVDIGHFYISLDNGYDFISMYDDNPFSSNMTLGYIPLETKSRSGIFHSVVVSNQSEGSWKIKIDNLKLSLNLGWISQYSEGFYYKFSLGPGIEYSNNTGSLVSEGFFLNASGSVGFAF